VGSATKSKLILYYIIYGGEVEGRAPDAVMAFDAG
jgi:hypothetical protein